MTILIRTDKPEAELYLYQDRTLVDSVAWQAHRQLAETIHAKLKDLLESNNLNWPDISGVGCFRGPGSFTGLRIGLTVANALANSLSVPIVTGAGDDWVNECIDLLLNGQNEQIAKPDYGRPAHITQQKK
jgi:tRNA threonylcarbamoyladenosine biosynthesis protein TsaB